MRIHALNAPAGEKYCICGQRRADVEAMRLLFSTPGALAALLALVREHQESQAQWAALFETESGDDQ